MPGSKVDWVADYFHYPISVSPLEKKAISTQVFNRLHNILQTATLYLTYPSNRTSRFSHSLGAMHLAGEMFRNGIINAREEHREAFLKIGDDVITEIRKRSDFERDVINLFSEVAIPHEIEYPSANSLLKHTYYRHVLPATVSERNQYTLIVLFQAVRLAALFHDIGHPPFSHISEDALTDIHLAVTGRQKNGEVLTQQELDFLDSDFLASSEPRGNWRDFHEELGHDLAYLVLDDIAASGFPKPQDIPLRYLALVCRYVVKDIYDNMHPTRQDSTTNMFRAMGRIIASDLDADRLDYVPRDICMSGLSREPIKYDRLVTSFQLLHRESSPDEFDFLPSARALSTIEAFFSQRADLYTHVIYHHRVVKTDALLKRAILGLAIRYLQGKVEESNRDSERYVIPSNISALWKVPKKSEQKYRRLVQYRYIQWDDTWLLSVLRKEYFRIVQEREIDNQASKSKEKTKLELQLEEILSNQKCYYSLIKRGADFREVDQAFIEAIPDSFDFSWDHVPKSNTWNEDDLERHKKRTEKVRQDYLKARETSHDTTTSQQYSGEGRFQGFFISFLRNWLTEVYSYSQGLASSDFSEPALEKLKQEFDLGDAFVEFKNFKAGVGNSFALMNDEEEISLGELSSIADELIRRRLLAPALYVYVYPRHADDIQSQITAMQKCLGEELAKAFYVWTQQSNI